MGNNYFEFKQFRVEQELSALKVGTDGVLLGAWTSVDNTQKILDIGTGTGLIALMLAQRCQAIIEAVEIDENAFKEASFNFSKSPWKERLNVYHQDFITMQENPFHLYDLIVSNPPFFIDSLKNQDHRLAVAKHNTTLTYDQLLSKALTLLAKKGRLSVVIPSESIDLFRESARLNGFYLRRRTDIIPVKDKKANRVLLEFSLNPCYPITDSIILRDESGQLTRDFKQLTSSYYLNF